MSRAIPVTFTNMCMVSDGPRVLVQDRTDPDWPGLTFPGGHVEPGESFTASVIREVREETGLTVSHPRLCGMKDWENPDGSRYVVFCYRAERFTGTLHDSEEGPVFWARLEDLPREKLANDFEEMLSLFLDEQITEFYFEKAAEGWISSLL